MKALDQDSTLCQIEKCATAYLKIVCFQLTEGTMEEMRLFETEDSSEDEDENPLSLASKRFQGE